MGDATNADRELTANSLSVPGERFFGHATSTAVPLRPTISGYARLRRIGRTKT
jgi:hypothetical protein